MLLGTNPHAIMTASGLAPHLKAMGLILRMALDYRNKHCFPLHVGVVSYLRAEATVQRQYMVPPHDLSRIPTSVWGFACSSHAHVLWIWLWLAICRF